MKTLVDQLAKYATYHRDRRNIATHLIGIPMIVVSIAILLSRPGIDVGGVLLTPALVLTGATVLYYFLLDLRFGLVMAVLLNSDRRGFSLMRGMFFSPVVLSMSAAGVLWTFVLDYRTGLLNSVLKSLGLGDWAQPWMSQPSAARAASSTASDSVGWPWTERATSA